MRFSDFWKSFNNPEARAEQLQGMMTSIDKEMQSFVDPTRWRHLLDQKQDLEYELEGLNLGPLPPLRME